MRNRKPSRPTSSRRPPRGGTDGSTPNRSGVRISLGIHAVKEALKVRPAEIIRLLVRQKWESTVDLANIVREARRHKVTVEERSPEGLDRIGHQNQGVVCEIKGRPMITIDALGASERSIVVALDGVEDPHNLGAILRTCWLMGVEAVLLPTDRAVSLVPTVHKVSCGGVEHVPVLEVGNLSNVLEELKKKGYWVFGMAFEGSKPLTGIKIPEKIVWVLGAEDKGLRTTTQRSCDELVSVPQLDNAASYNVSVAAGITLYETLRQAGKEKI